MSRQWVGMLLVVFIALEAVPAAANDYLVGSMFTTPSVRRFRTAPIAAAPAVAAPVAAAPAYYPQPASPCTTCRPVCPPQPACCPQTTYYRPAPQCATGYSPVAAAPVAAQPYYRTTYAPVVAPAPVVAARPAVVRTKVYYPGQPLFNLGRLFTPGVPAPAVAPY